MKCTHRQRWEHWIPALRIPQIESGKLVCGSERDAQLYPNYKCSCPQDCECRRKP